MEQEPQQQHLLQLTTETNNEQLIAQLEREGAYLSSVEAMASSRSFSLQSQWRPKIFDWFYKTIDHFKYDRELVAVAMDILDRYQIMYPSDMGGELYQLAAMTSLYISIKSHSNELAQSFELTQYVNLSRGQFCAQDLTQMELKIFNTLDWKLNPVIPSNFLVTLLGCLSLDCDGKKVDANFVLTVIYEVARYLIEVSIASPAIRFYGSTESETTRPSNLCYAALLTSLDFVSPDYLPMITKEAFLKKSMTILNADTQEILRLKRVVIESFVPSAILNENLPQHEISRQIRELHPLEILRNSGILCLQSEETLISSFGNSTKNKGKKRKQPMSPHSVCD